LLPGDALLVASSSRGSPGDFLGHTIGRRAEAGGRVSTCEASRETGEGSLRESGSGRLVRMACSGCGGGTVLGGKACPGGGGTVLGGKACPGGGGTVLDGMACPGGGGTVLG
jgi:hypothetical protein